MRKRASFTKGVHQSEYFEKIPIEEATKGVNAKA